MYRTIVTLYHALAKATRTMRPVYICSTYQHTNGLNNYTVWTKAAHNTFIKIKRTCAKQGAYHSINYDLHSNQINLLPLLTNLHSIFSKSLKYKYSNNLLLMEKQVFMWYSWTLFLNVITSKKLRDQN